MDSKQYLDRRNFFRVDDSGIIKCTMISPEQKQVGIEQLQTNQIEYQDAAHVYLSLDAKVQEKMRKVQDEALKEVLELFNSKMNILAQSSLNTYANSIFSLSEQPISLSASGVGYVQAQALTVGDDCQIELVLCPEKTHILAFGHVVSCDQDHLFADERLLGEAQTYRIGVVFDYMQEADMEYLIQHIMRVEARLIRQSRKGA